MPKHDDYGDISNGKTAFCPIVQDDTSHGKTTLTTLCLIMVQVMVHDGTPCVLHDDTRSGKTTLIPRG